MNKILDGFFLYNFLKCGKLTEMKLLIWSKRLTRETMSDERDDV